MIKVTFNKTLSEIKLTVSLTLYHNIELYLGTCGSERPITWFNMFPCRV